MILNLYRIVAKILWNQTPQAITSRPNLKRMYRARYLDTQDFRKILVFNQSKPKLIKYIQNCAMVLSSYNCNSFTLYILTKLLCACLLVYTSIVLS